MRMIVDDIYDDEASLFSDSDEQYGEDGDKEAESVEKSQSTNPKNNELSPIKPGEVVRDNCCT